MYFVFCVTDTTAEKNKLNYLLSRKMTTLLEMFDCYASRRSESLSLHQSFNKSNRYRFYNRLVHKYCSLYTYTTNTVASTSSVTTSNTATTANTASVYHNY